MKKEQLDLAKEKKRKETKRLNKGRICGIYKKW